MGVSYASVRRPVSKVNSNQVAAGIRRLPDSYACQLRRATHTAAAAVSLPQPARLRSQPISPGVDPARTALSFTAMINVPADAKFRASKLKIERGKQLIAELDREIRSYAESRPCALVVEHADLVIPEAAPNPDRCVLVVGVSNPFPECLALTTGDAIHNLRAALDMLAGDAVRLAGKNGDDARFPFATDAANLEVRIAKSELGKAGDTASGIVRALQPYPGGRGHALRALHDLDIADKHVSVLEAFSTGLPPDIHGAVNIIGARIGPLRDGVRYFAGPRPVNCRFGDRFNLPFTVEFAAGLSFAEQPLVPALQRMANEVETVAVIFESKLT